MNRSLSAGAAAAAALCAGCALLAANALLGDLNQDEGWYLYAARMVRTGSMPYRDFAYTQAPVMPFAYSAAEPLVRRHGLLAGRFFTAALGMGAALMAAALAARMTGEGERLDAAALALILILVNVYQAYFFTVVKTYALTSFFLLAGFLALSAAIDRRSRALTALSGVLMVLAACTRTSAGVILPVVFVFLCLERNSRAFRGWFWYLAGALPAACAVILPFAVVAPGSFWFCVVAYHALRESGGVAESLVYKAGFISRMVGAYFVAIGLCGAVFLAGWFRRFARQADETGGRDCTEAQVAACEAREAASTRRGGLSFLRLTWVTAAAVTLVHISAPFPYDDYQAFIFPLFAAAVSVTAIRSLRRLEACKAGGGCAWQVRSWLLSLVFFLCMGSALSSPLNQDWFVLGRDRIWWRLKERPPLAKLRETGRMIRSMARPGDLLLTQDPYLAVESGLTLPRGLEMGQFSYFPDFSDEQARKLHVLNRARFKKLLRETDAPVAALSGYAFAIRSPRIEPVPNEEREAFWSEIDRRYEKILEIPDFGQAFTTLRVFRRRDSSAECVGKD